MKIAFYTGEMGKKHASRIMELLQGYAPHHQYHLNDETVEPDLWHCMMPYGSIRYIARAPRTVVLLTDERPLTHPQLFSLTERLFLLPLYRYHCRHAARLIAPNGGSKRRLIEALGVDEQQVMVCTSIHHLSEENTPTTEEMLALRSKLGLAESYILVVGQMDTMHGHTTILHSILASPHSLNVVIYGRRTTHSDVLLEAVRDAGAATRIQFIYEVEPEDISALYRMAFVMLYFPTFESSVAPIVEALCQRVPMILSDIPTNREVGGSAATYVEPYDESALSAALKRVIYNESFRGQLIAQCWAESRRYSKEEMAQQLANIYESVDQ